jgi:uncharacterized protein YndB with AHSA1/START domain
MAVLAVLEMGWWPRGARLCALVLGVALAVPGLTRADQCVACEADVAAGRRDFSDEQWAAMQRGEVVSSHQDTSASTESENQLIEASAIVPRPPALVWSVITDFDGRPKFMGNVKAAHVVRTEGNRVWVSEKLKVWGVNIDYNIIGTLDTPHGVFNWVLDKSKDNDVAESVGSWQLYPLDDGQRTLLQYRSHLDTGRAIPGFIESFLTRRSLPEIVENVRNEVQHRYPILESGVQPDATRP